MHLTSWIVSMWSETCNVIGNVVKKKCEKKCNRIYVMDFRQEDNTSFLNVSVNTINERIMYESDIKRKETKNDLQSD